MHITKLHRVNVQVSCKFEVNGHVYNENVWNWKVGMDVG